MQLLRDRRLALLVAGNALNEIGSWCTIVALWGFASFRLDAGPGAIALLGLAWALPPVLLGPLAGVPIDRLGPKRVLVLADAVAALVSLSFLLAGSFPVLVALAALHGVTSSFSDPAWRALPPRLVDDEHLVSANAVLAAAGQSAIVFGPLLAAVSISTLGIEGAFVIDALTYVVGVLVLIPFHVGGARAATADRARVSTEIRDGLRIVRHRPRLRLLLGMSGCVYLIWGAFLVIEPVYVREVLHGSASTLALLQTTFGVGLLATTLVVTRLGERVARVRVAAVGTAASGVAAALYVGTAVPLVAFVGIGVWGCVTAFFVVPARTLVQRSAPVETHGRVLALDGTMNNGGHLVALPLVGVAAAAVGVQAAGVGLAVVPIVGGLVTLWRVRADAPAAVVGAPLDAPVEPVAAQARARLARRPPAADNDAMAERLDDATIAARLGDLTGWSREGDTITKGFACPSFAAAIAFVVRIGFHAEAANHHPDIDVRWRTVRIGLSTHDAGGLTALDFDLAGRIDDAAP